MHGVNRYLPTDITSVQTSSSTRLRFAFRTGDLPCGQLTITLPAPLLPDRHSPAPVALEKPGCRPGLRRGTYRCGSWGPAVAQSHRPPPHLFRDPEVPEQPPDKSRGSRDLERTRPPSVNGPLLHQACRGGD